MGGDEGGRPLSPISGKRGRSVWDRLWRRRSFLHRHRPSRCLQSCETSEGDICSLRRRRRPAPRCFISLTTRQFEHSQGKKPNIGNIFCWKNPLRSIRLMLRRPHLAHFSRVVFSGSVRWESLLLSLIFWPEINYWPAPQPAFHVRASAGLGFPALS